MTQILDLKLTAYLGVRHFQEPELNLAAHLENIHLELCEHTRESLQLELNFVCTCTLKALSQNYTLYACLPQKLSPRIKLCACTHTLKVFIQNYGLSACKPKKLLSRIPLCVYAHLKSFHPELNFVCACTL